LIGLFMTQTAGSTATTMECSAILNSSQALLFGGFP